MNVQGFDRITGKFPKFCSFFPGLLATATFQTGIQNSRRNPQSSAGGPQFLFQPELESKFLKNSTVICWIGSSNRTEVLPNSQKRFRVLENLESWASNEKFLQFCYCILLLTLIGMRQGPFTPLIIFGLDFVSWIFIKDFQTFLEVKIEINWDNLTPCQNHWVL